VGGDDKLSLPERVTHKSSTILISAGGRLQSFRSLQDVPAPLRERLIQSTSGPYSATLLIADEKGRQELLRSLRGQPSGVSTQWTRQAMQALPAPDVVQGAAFSSSWQSPRVRRVAEIALLVGIGVCLWLLAAWR
jgi:hypothetical protein